MGRRGLQPLTLGRKAMNSTRYLFIMSVVALVTLLPISAYGKAEAGKPPPADQMNTNTPPVEQPLVPEGVFAVQLVEALKIGQVQDEVQAENTLSSVGIEPKNGWIAGYPVTPPIISEIEKGVAAAAEAGKLRMGKGEALKAVGDLKARLGLSITPGAISQPAAPQTVPGGGVGNSVIYKFIDKNGVIHFTDQYDSIPMEYRNRVETIQGKARPPSPVTPTPEDSQPSENISIPNPGPEVVNNYYYDSGPPVVTYYEPPQPYYYLYAWVPYPFWCSGFYFSGFFILHDFHRHVFFHKRPFVVTNHVVTHHQGFFVDPVNRNLRPSRIPDRIPSAQVFNTPRVQSGARTIVGPSQKRMAPATVPTPSRMTKVAPPAISKPAPTTMTKAPPSTSMARPQGSIRPNQPVSNGQRSLPRNNPGPPRVTDGRTISPPAVKGSFSNPSPPRVASPPAVSQGRVFSSPAPSGRGLWGGFHGGEGLGNGSFFGGGLRGNR
jgi:hypothetical protein